MEMSSAEDPEQPVVPLPNDVDHHQGDQTVPEFLSPEDAKLEPEIAEEKRQEAEVRGVLEVIASTGKFWHDWGKLKTMLSFRLKQLWRGSFYFVKVLSGYPEAKTNDEEQNASLSETYADLVKRLDQALHSFQVGPPFTLQRLCKILLAARSIYPNVSKLALALEKNLLVTSTLTICTDPYPQTEQKPDQPEKLSEEPNLPSV